MFETEVNTVVRNIWKLYKLEFKQKLSYVNRIAAVRIFWKLYKQKSRNFDIFNHPVHNLCGKMKKSGRSIINRYSAENITRLSSRKKTKSRRLCEEVVTPRHPEGQVAGEQDSESTIRDTQSESTLRESCPTSTATGNAPEMSPAKQEQLIFPQRITQRAHNELVTNPSLMHTSKTTKVLLCDILNEIENIYQKALKALPLKNVNIKLSEVVAPFSDPKLDTVLDKLQDIEDKVQQLNNRQAEGLTNETGATQCNFSYAQALKKPKSTLVIKHPAGDGNPRDVLNKIKNLKCPENVKITKLKLRPKTIEIRCDTEENKNHLHSFLEEQLQEEVHIEEKKPLLWRLLVLNVPEDTTEAQLQTAIATDTSKKAEIWAIRQFKARRANCKHWVFLCPKRLAMQVIYTGSVVVGFIRVRVKKYVKALRCHRCQHINHHHTNECHKNISKRYCPKCGENHKEEDCIATGHNCINCGTRNNNLVRNEDIPENEKLYLPTDHSADAPFCPTYLDILNERLHQTEYAI